MCAEVTTESPGFGICNDVNERGCCALCRSQSSSSLVINGWRSPEPSKRAISTSLSFFVFCRLAHPVAYTALLKKKRGAVVRNESGYQGSSRNRPTKRTLHVRRIRPPQPIPAILSAVAGRLPFCRSTCAASSSHAWCIPSIPPFPHSPPEYASSKCHILPKSEEMPVARSYDRLRSLPEKLHLTHLQTLF